MPAPEDRATEDSAPRDPAPRDPAPDERVFGDIGTRKLFDNDQMSVWELRLDPGQTSDLHRHDRDYVMVQIAGDRVAARFEPDTGGTFAGHDYLEGEVSPGAVVFARAGGIETAINVGDQPFHEVVVEMKSRQLPGLLPVQHISLSVDDHDRAIGFYTDVLGFEVLPRPDFGIAGSWLVTGNGIQIHLIEDEGFVAPAGPHIAFETTDMAAEVARLRGLGVEVGDPFELNGSLQTFFNDPAGNQFELNQPRPS